MKHLFSLLAACLFQQIAIAQTSNSLSYLEAFAEAYGYVKYFHPADAAADIDWANFAIYGAEEMAQCKSDKQAVQTLNRLFQPMAPAVRFSTENTNYDLKAITPPQTAEYKPCYWQHNGLAVGMHDLDGTYRSVRVNRQVKTDHSSGFGNILTNIDATPYLGKKLRYTGVVKLGASTEGSGHLWFRVDHPDKSLGFFENMGRNPIKSKKWQRYEIIAEVDSIAAKLVFGCFLLGKGELQVDELRLSYEENGQWVEIPLTNGGFETEGLDERRKGDRQWYTGGKGYAFEITDQKPFAGEKVGKITFVGDEEVSPGTQQFDFTPKFGELIEKEIAPGIYGQIPLVLYCNQESTFPAASAKPLQQLKKQLAKVKPDPKQLAVRLGNVINVFNVFQHFYPYFEEVKVDWAAEFGKALQRCYSDQNTADHLRTLQKFTATLKDGHIRVSNGRVPVFAPPITWEWLEDQLVITRVWAEGTGLEVGDVITHVNGISAREHMAEIHSTISAATPGNLRERAQILSFCGEEGSEMILTSRGKEHRLVRDKDFFKEGRDAQPEVTTHRMLEPGMMYLNLDLISWDSIEGLMPQLEQCKAIVCDLRGYPNGNHEFIRHLMKTDDTARAWMQIPQIVYPNQENITGYEKHDWTEMMKAKTPYLGDKNIVFIINGRAISYAESYMGFIEGYKLATIVGEPTAGTNGNVNSFLLPGGYYLGFTGMKVYKQNGSQHHGVGILPNVPVRKTIAGMKAGKDEYLEKAMEIARKK